jgi:thiamine biosynthesis lipoprotein
MSIMLRRARPWLGTLVEIGVDGLDPARAAVAIEAAFVEVACVHRCMSFHCADSDLGRLHAARVGAPVEVDAHTVAVLRCALRVAQASRGAFDPTKAALFVAQGRLPAPVSAFLPDPAASWRDIELIDARHVRLRRALWLDLGGIAKGYAVDCAIAILRAAGAPQAVVNAGGDLRVIGRRTERVLLRVAPDSPVHAIELSDGAVASSASSSLWRFDCSARRVRTPSADRRSEACSGVSVVAPSCMVADALTKVVLAAEVNTAAAVLAAFDAQALQHFNDGAWRGIGVAA